jgi:hypothetical protein
MMSHSQPDHPAPPGHPFVETLEGRRLLSGDEAPATALRPGESTHGVACPCTGCCPRAVDLNPVTTFADAPRPIVDEPAADPASIHRLRGGFKMNVNFQPADATEVPAGFRVDLGRPFLTRANGFSYGWDRNIENETRDRNANGNGRFGEQFDTFVHTRGASWSVAVPNGFYAVNLIAGDENYLDSEHRFNVNGQPAMQGVPRETHPWIEGLIVVEVTDNLLTVSTDSRADNPKLSFVTILQVQPPPPVGDGQDIAFSQVGTGPADRIEAGKAVVGDKVYVMGGYINNYSGVSDRFDIYDKTTGTWSEGPAIPGAETHFAVAHDDRYIYKLGGQLGVSRDPSIDFATAQSWRFDTVTGTWDQWVDLPAPRLAGTAVIWNGAIHHVGGTFSDGITATKEHVRYVIEQDVWQRMPDLPRAGDHLGGALIGSEWFALGGEHGHGVSYVQHRDVFSYDHTKGYWEARAAMPEALSHFEGNIVQHEGQLIVAGGRGHADTRVSSIYSYDPIADLWSDRGNLPQPRFGGISWIETDAAGNDRLFYYAGDVFGQSRDDILAADL